MNVLIMYLSNEGKHAAACRGNSSIPTNATHLLHHCYACTNLAVATLHTSIQSPTTTHQLLAYALPRMTWQVHSASKQQLNLGTTVRIPKGVPVIERYTHLFLIFYLISLHLYMHLCIYIYAVAYRVGGFGVFKPPTEILKISVDSSIALARRTGVSISFCRSLCSHTVVIY